MFEHLPVTMRSIILRKLRADDLAAFHVYRNDPNVARFQGWSPMSIEQAAGFLDTRATHVRLVPGQWHQIGVASVDGNALIGDMGVWLSGDQSQAELGLSITPGAQGKGHGTDAVRGLLHLLFFATPVTEVIAKTDARNLACLAILGRAGMRCTATSTADYKGETCTEHLFAATRAAD